MAKFSWSEIFLSLEGESVSPIGLGGHPTVYIRFTGCNMTCQKFNNPNNVKITNEVLGFNPKDYTNIKEMPLISMGCDSLYAHDTRFSHTWIEGDEHVLANKVIEILPHHKWNHPVTGLPYILSLTGGEPILRSKHLPILLNHPLFNDLQIILIETNCSVPIHKDFQEFLNIWMYDKPGRQIIWSNSPKLSASGEAWDKAIQPNVALQQTNLIDNGLGTFKQYFKFVCGPNDNDFDEVEKAMNEYYAAGISKLVPVGIMPMAATSEQQEEIAQQVAQKCIERGYVYTCRLQNYLWKNEVGT